MLYPLGYEGEARSLANRHAQPRTCR
ncbi:MAG: hypothetical protein K0Q76_3380, partial [Panacagrimonas sp.]|nr:hypothetical protein [Panacagrimonas sp.]